MGGLIGGALSLLGGERRNSAQTKASQAQMDFQERMSSTAHQRQISDLRKAGINPMLSGKFGGSSSPGGAMPQIQDTLTPAVNTALSTQQTNANVELATQQANKTFEEFLQAQYDTDMSAALKGEWARDIRQDLLEMDKKQQQIYIDTMNENLKVAKREGNLADSQLGQITRIIREITGALGLSFKPIGK